MLKTYCIIFMLMFNSIVLGQIPDLPPVEIIDPNVAIFTALTYVPTFYPGNWSFYKIEHCYNLDHSVSAYIIIFKNLDKIEETPRQLNNSLLKSDIEIKKFEQEKAPDIIINQIKRERYYTKDYTTIIVGGTSYSPIIIRWFPGLPEYIVKKNKIEEWLKKECSESSFSLQKLIYIGPKDIRYEVVSNKKENYLVDFSKKEFKIEPIEKIKKETNQQFLSVPSDLPENQKRIIEEGIKAQKLRNIQLWQNYKILYQNTIIK
jgi:hypothetical protein